MTDRHPEELEVAAAALMTPYLCVSGCGPLRVVCSAEYPMVAECKRAAYACRRCHGAAVGVGVLRPFPRMFACPSTKVSFGLDRQQR